MCRGDCTLFWLGNPPSRALYLGEPPPKHRQNRLPRRMHLFWLGTPPSWALYLGEPPPKTQTESLAATDTPVLVGEPPLLGVIFGGTPPQKHRQNRLPHRLHLSWLGPPHLRTLLVLQCGKKVGLGCGGACQDSCRLRAAFLPPAPLRSHKRMVEIRFGAKPCPAWLSGPRHFSWSRFWTFPPVQDLEILNLDHSFSPSRLAGL